MRSGRVLLDILCVLVAVGSVTATTWPAEVPKEPVKKVEEARIAPEKGAKDRTAEPRRDGGRNLVVNGDFETPDGDHPKGWQFPDGLTTFWTEVSGRKGKVVKINTDVLARQFRDREDAIAKAEGEKKKPPPAPKPLPTQDPKYDTVAGLDGVHFRSDEIPVKPTSSYKLQVDVKVDGKASPKVWIKAYAKRTSAGVTRDRIIWKKSLACDGASTEWKTFAMVFPANTKLPKDIEKVRVELYPYWPPATYYFDNVKLTEIDEAEVRRFEAEAGHRVPDSEASPSRPAASSRKK
jgi:hypothetical protein